MGQSAAGRRARGLEHAQLTVDLASLPITYFRPLTMVLQHARASGEDVLKLKNEGDRDSVFNQGRSNESLIFKTIGRADASFTRSGR